MQNKKNATGDLRKIQLLQLDILKEIDRLCKEMGLEYYIIAGTLLGAIRHGGFIPWDSDIDIAMFRSDYERLLKEGNNKIDQRFYIQSDYSDKNHKSSFAKVRALNTLYIEKGNKVKGNYNGFYIDIFPLDDIKSEPSRFDYYNAKVLKLLQRVKAFKRGKVHSTTTIRTIVSLFLGSVTFFIPTTTINNFIKKRMTKDNNKGFRYVTNYCSKYGIKKQFMEKEVYGEPTEIEFEGYVFWGPKKYKFWLEKIYGDYMKLPNKIPNTHEISSDFIYDLGPYK